MTSLHHNDVTTSSWRQIHVTFSTIILPDINNYYCIFEAGAQRHSIRRTSGAAVLLMGLNNKKSSNEKPAEDAGKQESASKEEDKINAK